MQNPKYNGNNNDNNNNNIIIIMVPRWAGPSTRALCFRVKGLGNNNNNNIIIISITIINKNSAIINDIISTNNIK